MGDEWPERVLSDLISVKHGWAFKGSFFDEAAEKGPIVVAIGNFNYSGGFRFGSTKIKRYTSDYPADYELIPGEILLAMTCQTAGGEILGIPGKVPDDGNTYLHNQRLGKVIVESESVDDGYLYWLFLSKGFNHHLYCTATGTKILHTAPERILSYRFFLPSLPEQKAIAHILGTLDDKIELNRQMNATLEAMAQALFKSWFVDFDPVIDKALAAGNPIPESFHKRAEARRALGDRRNPLPADIAQHFPDRFVFNEEMGWVPEGWEVETIGRVLELAYGKSLPAKKRIAGDIPVYGSGGISGSHNEKLVEGPGIIVGRKGTVGSLYWVENDYFPIDTVFYVIRKLDLPLYWIYQSLQLIDIKSLGADSAVPGVNRNAVYAKHFTIPKNVVFQGYLNVIENNIAKRKNIDSENGTLTNLRDTLLPKLLSGQLRIPDAEKIMNDA